ncbi:hypothetical protein C8R44DRAFT_782683 [Mycena epipterygia]|nr:hypothetical protein C8R44DRAFT_782683 [Mycena epipterygia]
MVQLNDLPADVIFHILSKMRLQDAWSLAALSRTFRDLSRDRSFWIIVLKSSPSIQSVSNPLTLDDLSAMSLTSLKRLVLHAMKLERNWTRTRPQIIGQVRRWNLGDRSILETNHLFQFPGSELFMYYSGKFLKCFNLGTCEYTTVLDLDAYVRCASYDFLPDKSVILGIALRGGSRFNIPMLQFIKIQMNPDKTGVAATKLLQPPLAEESDCQKPFVSSRIVGAVQSRGNVTEILAYDLISGGHTTVRTDIPINYAISRRLDFSFFHGNLYLLADDGPRAVVYCCPRDSLPYKHQQFTTPSILTFGNMDPMVFPTKIWKRRGPVCQQMFRDTSFVKVHDSLGAHGSHFVTTFRFWRDSNLPENIPREITVPGMCSGELSLQISPTGHYVAASLLGLGQPKCSLILIRSHPDLASCSSHELELPADVGTGAPPNVLAVDDHRGVIYLIEHGDLLSIPYA